MPAPLCVAIYGNALPLAGIAIAMQHRQNLRVVSILEGDPGEVEQLNAIHPDVILFDQGQAGIPPVLTCIEPSSNLLLIGVDANNNRVSVWSGREMSILSIHDLLGTIDRLFGCHP